jgi:hypothetical protein
VPAFSPSGLVSPGIAEEVFDICLTRLVQRGIERPELNLTFNPPTPQHWVNKRIVSKSPEALKAMNTAHFFFPGKENEHNLRAGYYDQLRAFLAGKDTMIARFVDGQVVAIYPGAPVYQKNFNSNLHVSNTVKYDPARPLITCWDNPPTPACLITQIDVWGRWVILKELQGGFIDGKIMEYVGQQEFTDLVLAEIRQYYPNAPLGKAWMDQANKAPSNTENTTPVQVMYAKGFREVGFGAVDNMSRQEAVNGLLARLVSGKGAIVISAAGCPLLIEGLAGGYRYGLATDGVRTQGNAPLKNEFSHLCNALEYGASGLFPAARVMTLNANKPKVAPSAMSA